MEERSGRRENQTALFHLSQKQEADFLCSHKPASSRRPGRARGRRHRYRDGGRDKGLVDIHDRRPLVMTRSEWMSPDTTPEQAEELAHDCAISADEFTFYPIGRAVGNIHNDVESIIKRINNP